MVETISKVHFVATLLGDVFVERVFNLGYFSKDINECGENNGGCSDICTNDAPGFECSCPEGFLLDEEGFTCL